MRQVLSRQVLGKGLLTAAAASSLLSIATGSAYAYSGATAEASHSPGLLAGNSVSAPITLDLNVCGNSVDGGAAVNPAMGNTCATTTSSHADDELRGRHAVPEHQDPPAPDRPHPLPEPVEERPAPLPTPEHQDPPAPDRPHPLPEPVEEPVLAETGAGQPAAAAALATALLLGGAILYRRSRIA